MSGVVAFEGELNAIVKEVYIYIYCFFFLEQTVIYLSYIISIDNSFVTPY